MKKLLQLQSWRSSSRFLTAGLVLGVVLAILVAATPAVQAQTFTLLYSFQGPPQDGEFPFGKLIFDKSGNLYGTTGYGGTASSGTVFELDTSGKESVLHNFAGSPGDGALPGEILRFGGIIYGATEDGGNTSEQQCDVSGCGTIFELSGGKVTILHRFGPDDGIYPYGGLAVDKSGNLYGAAYYGGTGTSSATCGTVGCGAVFEMSQGKETILHSFGSVPDGEIPGGGVLLDGAGNLYGTTAYGGTSGKGTVFELSPNSDGTWTEHILYSFRGKNDGAYPSGAVVMDENGSLYGTTGSGGLSTTYGGTTCQQGCGGVYKLKKNVDGTWAQRVLYHFRGTADGEEPFGLVRDGKGNLFGVAASGVSNDGIVFKLDPSGNETVLHAFTGGTTDGAGPVILTLDSAGNIYGATTEGGNGINPICAGFGEVGCGTLFKITP